MFVLQCFARTMIYSPLLCSDHHQDDNMMTRGLHHPGVILAFLYTNYVTMVTNYHVTTINFTFMHEIDSSSQKLLFFLVKAGKKIWGLRFKWKIHHRQVTLERRFMPDWQIMANEGGLPQFHFNSAFRKLLHIPML